MIPAKAFKPHCFIYRKHAFRLMGMLLIFLTLNCSQGFAGIYSEPLLGVSKTPETAAAIQFLDGLDNLIAERIPLELKGQLQTSLLEMNEALMLALIRYVVVATIAQSFDPIFPQRLEFRRTLLNFEFERLKKALTAFLFDFAESPSNLSEFGVKLTNKLHPLSEARKKPADQRFADIIHMLLSEAYVFRSSRDQVETLTIQVRKLLTRIGLFFGHSDFRFISKEKLGSAGKRDKEVESGQFQQMKSFIFGLFSQKNQISSYYELIKELPENQNLVRLAENSNLLEDWLGAFQIGVLETYSRLDGIGLTKCRFLLIGEAR